MAFRKFSKAEDHPVRHSYCLLPNPMLIRHLRRTSNAWVVGILKYFYAIQRNTQITSKVENHFLEDIKGIITIAVIVLEVITKITIKEAIVKENTLVGVAHMEVDMINIQIPIGMKTTGMVATITETIMELLQTMEDNKVTIENLINLDTEKKVVLDMEMINMVANLPTIQTADHTIITINTIQIKVDITVVKEMITIATTTNLMMPPQPLKDIIVLINPTHSSHSIHKTLLPMVYQMHHSNNPTLIMDLINMHQQRQVQRQQLLVTIPVTSRISSILKPTSNNIPHSIISKEFKANPMDIHNNRITDNLLNLLKLVSYLLTHIIHRQGKLMILQQSKIISSIIFLSLSEKIHP